jgi:hypothetical protein
LLWLAGPLEQSETMEMRAWMKDEHRDPAFLAFSARKAER